MKTLLSFLAGILVLTGCNRSEPTPPPPPPPKEPVPQSSALPPGHPPLDMSRQPLPPGAASDATNPQWTVPADWKEGAPGPMRRAQFSAPGVEVVVSVFPGDVGGLLANINRWRGQIGLGPVTPEEVPGMTSEMDVARTKGTLVDFKSDEKRMLVVIIPIAENSWFFKMTGEIPAVEAQKETFLQFVSSVRF
jgi:hypothetical protein